MKAVRVVQVVLVLLLALYLWLFHSANPVLVELPLTRFFLPLLPASLVVVFAMVIGWLLGWMPSAIAAWRRGREVKRLAKELEEANARLAVPGSTRGKLYPYEPEVAVIPDRGASFDAEPDDTTA